MNIEALGSSDGHTQGRQWAAWAANFMILDEPLSARAPRALFTVLISLSLWPWAWTLFLYAAALAASRRLGHWPGCCLEAAKWTLREPLATAVKGAGLFGPYWHATAMVGWVYVALQIRRSARLGLVKWAVIFATGIAVVWAMLNDLDPGRVLYWAVD